MTSATALLLLLAQAAPAAAPPAEAAAAVPFERLRAATEPDNWLTYSGTSQAHRRSPPRQIDARNVAGLRPLWLYQSREAGKLETSPIVIDGVLYITEKPHIVTALDGRTGRPLWSYRRPPARDV